MSQKSYRFVGPSATIKEKLLKARADVLSNNNSTLVNGLPLSEPSTKFMEKQRKTELMDK